MTLFEEVISNLKGVIASNKDGILIQRINSEYEIITGSKIPLNELKFNSTQSFIQSYPKLFRIQYAGGCLRVFNVISKDESESNLTLLNLIMNTTSKKANKFKTKQPFFKSKPGQFNGFQSNSFPFSNYQGNGNIHYKPSFDNHTSRYLNNHIAYPTNNPLRTIKNRDTDSDTNSKSSVSVISVSMQTVEIPHSNQSSPNGFLQPSEFIQILVNIIVEFKPLNLDTIVYFRIGTNLHHHFQRLTGLSIDPFLFRGLVKGALSNHLLHRTEMFSNQIYCDDTDRYCCLNLSTVNEIATVGLPRLQPSPGNSYPITVISTNRNGIVAVKFSDESLSPSSTTLRWEKNQPLSDRAKEIIQNQQFWAWMPGSICLVRLPVAIVRALQVDSVERAIIVSVQLVPRSDTIIPTHHSLLLHIITFYLIDHNRYVPHVPCCSSSFQDVKRATYRNNDSGVADVCNLSIRARCQPARIQFLRIINMKDVSHLLPISRGDSGVALIISQLVMSVCDFRHCQPVYECYARVPMDLHGSDGVGGRELNRYDDLVPCSNGHVSIATWLPQRVADDDDGEDDLVEVIVISDDEDDELERQMREKLVKLEITNLNLMVVPNGDVRQAKMAAAKAVTNVTEEDSISVISFTDDDNDDDERGNDNDVITIISSSSDDDGDGAGSNSNIDSMLSPVRKPVGGGDTRINNRGTTTAIVTKQQHNEKCLVPISDSLCGQFEGHVVRLMHVQRGVAAIGLLQSSGLMRRELLMLTLSQQELTGVMNSIAVTDYFVWCPTGEVVDCLKSYNDQRIALVEILQVINSDTALAALVHYGLVVTVKRDELCHIPDMNVLPDLIGPIVGAFDLHSIPNWFSVDVDRQLAGTLFTAFFINDCQLVLEHFDERGRFFNLDLISRVTDNLAVDHCNTRSTAFIAGLSESLMACRLFIGNLLLVSTTAQPDFLSDCLSIDNTLIPVGTDDAPGGIWFCSVDVESGGEDGPVSRKLSPQYFSEEKFAIDRVRMDSAAANKMRLLDCQNIEVDLPHGRCGLYRFDQTRLTEFMKSNAEILSRYMLFGAIQIPDLNCIFNKLIF